MLNFDCLLPSGQVLPFYPELIGGLAHSSPAFSSDGKEMYWSTVRTGDLPRTIFVSLYRGGNWSDPEPAPFSGLYNDDHPFISPDGSSIYFASNRPDKPGGEMKPRLWKADRKEAGWTTPSPLDIPFGFWTPSVTRKGTIYCLDRLENSGTNDRTGDFAIYRSAFEGGRYGTPEPLPPQINRPGSLNWCPHISPDETFLLFSSDRPGSSGSGDIYISFKNDSDEWSEAVNLGKEINTDWQERFPGLSPDGRYLFFTRSRGEENFHDMYWIDSAFIRRIAENRL